MGRVTTAPQPWPGLDDEGYGTGQGLSGYGLGDAVVKRDHLGALNPADGTRWSGIPASNSYEGDKHIEATPRGLFVGGDGNTKGGYNVGRIAFFDFNAVPAQNGTQTAITDPIEGRIKPVDEEFEITGTATAAAGVQRVEVEVHGPQLAALPQRRPAPPGARRRATRSTPPSHAARDARRTWSAAADDHAATAS